MSDLWRHAGRALPALLGLILLATGAHAQRPSLSGLEARLEAAEDANCLKADVDGDSYRPLYCDARCTCDIETPYPAGAVCTETTPGTYEVTAPESYLAVCFGACFDGTPCFDDSVCGNAPVPMPTTCQFFWGTCTGGAICRIEADCNLQGDSGCSGVQGGACADSARSCSVAGDCLSGFSCQNGRCVISTCNVGGVCDTGVADETLWRISGVSSSGSTTVASCDGAAINSGDANACVSAIESALGAACTPAP